MYKRNGNRGQTVPLIGLLFFLLTGFGALAIDMGYVNYQQMRMQTAADNAALAGGQALIAGGCPNQAAANTAAQNNAMTNGFGASDQVSVTVDNPPKITDGPYQNVNCAVSVMVNVQKNATWFLNTVGLRRHAHNHSGRRVARAKQPRLHVPLNAERELQLQRFDGDRS